MPFTYHWRSLCSPSLALRESASEEKPVNPMKVYIDHFKGVTISDDERNELRQDVRLFRLDNALPIKLRNMYVIG